MFFKTSDDLNMYYELDGNLRSKNNLLFLNGISQSTHSWELMLPAFSEKYRIVLCDFIFQGQSDKQGPVRSFDQHAADVLGLIQWLNLEKINLIGISYGSLVAQNFALNYSEKLKRLVLLSTFAYKTPYYKAIELTWGRMLDAGGSSGLLDVMIPSVFKEQFYNPSFKLNKQDAENEFTALKKLLEPLSGREDYREKLKTVQGPVLVIHGEKDALVPLEMGKAVADSIVGSKFQIIQGAGHVLNLESFSQTVELIKRFLELSKSK